MHKKILVVVFRRLEDQYQVLALQMNPDRNQAWGHVTGNVEKEEKSRVAASRELFEETGIRADLQKLNWTQQFQDRWNREVKEKAYLAITDNENIILDESEHQAYRWISLSNVNSNTFSYASHFQVFLHALQELDP